MSTSSANQKVKTICRLKKSTKLRREQKCFLVEGPRMFFEIPEDRILECYMTESFLDRNRDRIGDIPYELISDRVCEVMSDTMTPQGVIALVRRNEADIRDLLDRQERHLPCLFLLENIQDPGNLGTIIRTAEASGIDGIVIDRTTVDPYHMKVIRSTMGAVFRVPIMTVPDLVPLCEELKERGIGLYAAHLKGELFCREDYTRGCAFMIGNEGQGLSDRLSCCADRLIRIPMKGEVESLNAAVAASLLMYEVFRQRGWNI